VRDFGVGKAAWYRLYPDTGKAWTWEVVMERDADVENTLIDWINNCRVNKLKAAYLGR
jgi:hypothetical protein